MFDSLTDSGFLKVPLMVSPAVALIYRLPILQAVLEIRASFASHVEFFEGPGSLSLTLLIFALYLGVVVISLGADYFSRYSDEEDYSA